MNEMQESELPTHLYRQVGSKMKTKYLAVRGLLSLPLCICASVEHVGRRRDPDDWLARAVPAQEDSTEGAERVAPVGGIVHGHARPQLPRPLQFHRLCLWRRPSLLPRY